MNIPGTEEWNFTDVKFLSIFKEYAKRINLVETINTMTDSKMELSPGDAVLGMILDTVSGRTLLYRLEQAFDQTDTELIFGKPSALINLTIQISGGSWANFLRLELKRYFPRFPKMPLVALNWIRAITTLIQPPSPSLVPTKITLIRN